MPKTAFQHFSEDIKRAEVMVKHAVRQPSKQVAKKMLRDDVLRGAWMTAVGALDAYFCDAYADLVASCLISKTRQRNIRLGKKISSINVPAGTFFSEHGIRENWRWRMAARGIIEKDNVLSLGKISELLNPFLLPNHKFFGDVLDKMMSAHGANARMFATSRTAYSNMNAAQKVQARKLAPKQFGKRFRNIFQRRHDCIHNCDRPRIAIQPVSSPGTVANVIRDIRFVVGHCDSHLNREFPRYLISRGCTRATITLVGY